jgi:hypothetical protein
MDDAIQRKVARRKAGSKTSKASKKKSLPAFSKSRLQSKKKPPGAWGTCHSLCARAHLPPKALLPDYKMPPRPLSLSPPTPSTTTHPPTSAGSQSPWLPRLLRIPAKTPPLCSSAAPPRARLVQIGTRLCPRRRDGSRLAPSESEPAQRYPSPRRPPPLCYQSLFKPYNTAPLLVVCLSGRSGRCSLLV